MCEAQYGLRNQCEQAARDAIWGGSTGLPSSEGKRRRECTGQDGGDTRRFGGRGSVSNSEPAPFPGYRPGGSIFVMEPKASTLARNPGYQHDHSSLWLLGDGSGVFLIG